MNMSQPGGAKIKKINWQLVVNNDVDGLKNFCIENPTVDVNAPLLNGWTALMYACKEKNTEIVEYLLDKGANAKCHKDMFTAMMCTCSQNYVPDDDRDVMCVDLLAKHGADVNEMDRFHTTALMYAARSGNASVVRKLVDLGAVVDHQDSRGDTAVTLAAYRGNAEAVQTLCELGANTRIRSNNGDTAMSVAEEKSYTKIQEILSEYELKHVSEVDQNGDKDNDEDLEDEFAGGDASEGAHEGGESNLKRPISFGRPADYKEKPDFYENVMYGPMQMFLSGLDLIQYIPQFEKHCVTFPQLLRMEDDDLRKTGIKEYGVRLKILEAIKAWHMADLKPESLTQPARTIDAIQAVSVISNLSKHTALMASSLAYVSAQIHECPQILEGCADDVNASVLLSKCQVMARNTRDLWAEICKLEQYLCEISDTPHYQPADLICKRDVGDGGRTRWRAGTVMSACLGAAGLLLAVYVRMRAGRNH